MKEYESQNIINVAVCGHSGAGKSELLESVLYYNKITDRFGKAVDGNSIIDSDSEEVRRGMSIYTHLVPVEWKGQKINFLDTPGLDAEELLEVSAGSGEVLLLAGAVNYELAFLLGSLDEVLETFKSRGSDDLGLFFFLLFLLFSASGKAEDHCQSEKDR